MMMMMMMMSRRRGIVQGVGREEMTRRSKTVGIRDPCVRVPTATIQREPDRCYRRLLELGVSIIVQRDLVIFERREGVSVMERSLLLLLLQLRGGLGVHQHLVCRLLRVPWIGLWLAFRDATMGPKRE